MKATHRGLLAAIVLCTCAAGAHAVEPVERFLDAARAAGYYDEALVYLDMLEARGVASPADPARISYERGVTWLGQASQGGDSAVRRAQLVKAAEALEQFAAKYPEHDLAGSARLQLASLQVERGRSELRGVADGAGDLAAVAAREHYTQARAQFADADKQLTQQLAALPKLIPPDQPELQKKKLRWSGEQAQARLMLAQIDFELAESFAAASSEAKEHWTSAAKAYAALYEAYRTRAVGLLARLGEGRAYQALGRYDQALGCFGELMDLPDSAETRSIRAKSTRHALECWTQDSVRKYQTAIERGEQWQRERGNQANGAEDLAIRFLTAVAYQRAAQALPDQDPNRKRLTGTAREHVQAVARQPGEFQQPAKTLLVALQGRTPQQQTAADGKAAPKTFADALEQAQAAIAAMQEAATKGTPQQKNASAIEAMELLKLALRLRDADTPPETLASARYYLCYLNWDQGNYYDAAVLGEYLARRAPQTLPGRQGAKIALAAWVRLYSDAPEADRNFEIEQIQRVAEMTFKQWPDQPEAEEAALTLVNFAAAAGKVEQATEYLAKISADSPRRGQAELRAGQALWSTYLRALREPDGERPPREQLDALRKQSHEILKQGVNRVKSTGAVDASLASAVFSLAQISLEEDDAKQALQWLEDERLGPLALVKSGHAAAARDGFAVETYKMALRSYISLDPPQLEKAEEAMGALEKLVRQSGDAKAGDHLTAIYVSLGRQLQESLQNLRAAGKTKESARTAAAFQVFLDRLLERGAGGNLASLNWIAETYASLGSDFRAAEGGTSSKAQICFERSASAYKQLVTAAEKDPRYQESPDALIALRLKMADAYREAGNYDQATLAVDQVLRDKPSLITAQIAGAAIYQARGATDPTGYEKAIMGGSPDRNGRNRIWGWAQLSKVTLGNPKFAETFLEARLNIVESRYRYALVQQDATRRQNVLQAAVSDVRTTYNVNPELGGPEWTAKFDAALKRVQKALGQPEIGLEEIKKTTASAAAAK